jgi:hypothetical protein
MYAFAQRSDTQVVDEPLYAHYLSKTDSEADHPARAAILAAQPQDGRVVVRDFLSPTAYARPVVVFKQMTHHLIELDWDFLAEMQNVLLIRDPRAILASYSQVVHRPTARDIGVPQQYELWQHLKQSGHLHAVLDARLLLQDPPNVLAQLCERLAIPYTDNMLSWPAGPRPEDGVWAPYWYDNVHRSTGFQPYRKRTYGLPPDLAAIATACQPAYQAMLTDALRGAATAAD